MSTEKNIEDSKKKEELAIGNKHPDSNREGSQIGDQQPETKNQKQATANMETHAHHLHHAPGKKFWHYFFEFFMLFLAVTLGFFVDNWREHYVEKQREKKYVQSLYNDLRSDTFLIHRTYGEKAWIESKYDSALLMLAPSNGIALNNEFIYYIMRYLNFNDVFTSQDVTFQQLKSSGNFRYIENITMYKKIAEYYNLYDRYRQTEPGFGPIKNDALANAEERIFDVAELTSLDNESARTFYEVVKTPSHKLRPLVTTPENLRLLYLKIADAKMQTTYNKIFLLWVERSATGILSDLKKEYDLQEKEQDVERTAAVRN